MGDKEWIKEAVAKGIRKSEFHIIVTEEKDKINVNFERHITCWEHYFLAYTFIEKRLKEELWGGKKIIEGETEC